MYLRNVPLRLTTGAFILNSGIEKWKGGKEQAEGVHGMAKGAYPLLGDVDPQLFLRAVSAAEIATGVLLLSPVTSPVKAGAALTAFSGGLLGLYLRTPGMTKPNSILPSPEGMGVSKDVWMLGIGLSLVLSGVRRKVDSAVTSAKGVIPIG